MFATPLGDITIDTTMTEELSSKPGFTFYDQGEDEAEHSLEMHAPFIKQVFGDKEITLVPVVVGGIDFKFEQAMGKVFAPYLADE